MVSESTIKRMMHLDFDIKIYGEIIDALGVTSDYEEADLTGDKGPLWVWDEYVIHLADCIDELDYLMGLHPELEWS